MGKPIDPTVLASFVPLDALSHENLRSLANKASEEFARPGSHVFKAGDTDRRQIFIIDGTVELYSGRQMTKSIKGGTESARYAVAHVIPRTVTAKAKSGVRYVRVDSEAMDKMLTWDQTAGGYDVKELKDAADSADWMTRVLRSNVFYRVPPSNIQAMFIRMESVDFPAGAQVIKQDETGDYFFVIKEGKCRVTRVSPDSAQEIQLAEFGVGDSFGEEALIADATRNATVTMMTDGVLMRLSKEDFMSLLNEPMLTWTSFKAAAEMVLQGDAKWLDVRLPGEREQVGYIAGSISIPLIFLRMKMSMLDEKYKYIVYCDTGRRSSTAAFLLSERGFETLVLEDGTGSLPEAVLVKPAPSG